MHMSKNDPIISLFQHAPIGLARVDLEGRWQQINSALCDMTGYSEEELLHTNFMSITHPEDIYRDVVYIDRILAGQINSYELEKRYIHKKGHAIWVSLDVSLIPDSPGVPAYFAVCMKEITSRKQAEQFLKESEQRYRSLFEHDPDMVYELTPEGRMISLNQACERITGYAQKELTHIGLLVKPEDLERVNRSFDKAARGFLQTYEMTFRHKKGHFIDLQVAHVPVLVDGAITAVYGVAKDITELKKQSRALQENEERYRVLAQNSIDVIIRYSSDGTILYASPSSITVTGYQPEELLRQQGLEFVHPEDQASIKKLYETLQQDISQIRNTFRIIKKDGTAIWIEAANKIVRHPVMGVPVEFISVFHDITEQRLQQEKLRISESLYKLVSENAQDSIAYLSPAGMCEYVSPSVRNLLGYEPEEMVGRPAAELYHPDDLASLDFCKFFSYSDVDVMTVRVLHKGGHYVWMESILKLIRGEQGNIEKILSVSRDISERKAAEEDLRMQEKRYRDLVEHSPDAVIISSKGKWLYVNDTAVELLGGKSKEEVLKHSYAFIHPDCLNEAQRSFERVEGGQASELVEHQFIRLDGQIIDVEVKSLPTIYQQEEVVHTIVRNISERNKTQELLKASEKLNIAGQLAAGIAHEIRNPLTSLKGFLQLIRSGTGGKKEHFDIMRDEIDRIELIVSELLVLAKPEQGTAFRRVDIPLLLGKVITLLEAQAIMSNVQIEACFDEQPLIVLGDENQLKQVYINMIKNAIEAMPEGGSICVEVVQQGSSIHVRIIDQGSGIPEESIPRIGEPFYTTKQTGTGLGLMVSYKIIEHHGGDVVIKSKMGIGTTFDISLPSAQAE